eukprot:gb/GEZN01006392.1/.p1 GENE.gb/GEZN01006392.1/~~gb/GEZN01006392.1/.p1  ORF type:complete len:390 (+),score=47.76 gb/GEZN01006392.1/:34-1170(+)
MPRRRLLTLLFSLPFLCLADQLSRPNPSLDIDHSNVEYQRQQKPQSINQAAPLVGLVPSENQPAPVSGLGRIDEAPDLPGRATFTSSSAQSRVNSLIQDTLSLSDNAKLQERQQGRETGEQGNGQREKGKEKDKEKEEPQPQNQAVTSGDLVNNAGSAVVEVFSPQHANVLSVLMLLFGPFICFFGHRLFPYVLAMVGFLLGSYAALYTMHRVAPGMKIGSKSVIGVVSGIVGGVFLAWAITFGIFVLGGVSGLLLVGWGYQIGIDLIHESLYNPQVQAAVYISGAIVGACLAVCLFNYVVKFLTAFLGGFMIAAAIDHFGGLTDTWPTSLDPFGPMFGHPDLWVCEGSCIAVSVLWLGLSLIGVWYQLSSAQSKDEE